MMISTFLPVDKLTCGDSWSWSLSLASYPAGSGWVVSYVFKAPGVAPFTLVSVPDGESHSVTSDSATTATLTPGRYKVQVFVTSSDSQRQTMGLAEIELLPDLSVVSADYDPRTPNEIALQVITDVLAGSASRSTLETVFKDYTAKYKSTNELIRLRNYYQMEVNRERGLKDGRVL